MKKAVVVIALVVFSAIQFSCVGKSSTAAKPELKTFVSQYSYMIGQDIGNSVKGLNTELDTSALLYALQDALKGRPSLIAEKELDSIKREFGMKMQQAQMEKMQKASSSNTQEGDTFLAENKKKAGVITTASGLQYTVVKLGTGAKPKATDRVKVHYEGKLIDGKVFDSSLKRGEPVVFPVNGVIAGWTEVLQLMPVGSKYNVVIPSNLGYGAQGAGQDIGPNAVLVFDVELIAIESDQPAAK